MEVTHVKTNQQHLNELPVKAGQLIFVEANQTVYWDENNSTRIELSDVSILETDEERLGLTTHTAKLYLVQSPSPVLWRYQDNMWKAISSDVVYYGSTKPTNGAALWIDPSQDPEVVDITNAMLRDVYDTQSKKQDVFMYTDSAIQSLKDNPTLVGGIPIVRAHRPSSAIPPSASVYGFGYEIDLPWFNGVERTLDGVSLMLIPDVTNGESGVYLRIIGMDSVIFEAQVYRMGGSIDVYDDIEKSHLNQQTPFLVWYSESFGNFFTDSMQYVSYIKIRDVAEGKMLVGGKDSVLTVKTPAEVRKHIGAAVPATEVAVTLTAAGWSGSGPYTQTVSVAGLLADQKGDIGLAQSATAEQRAAAREAMISVTGQAAGSLTVTADGEKPGVDIPCVVVMLG